MKIKPLIFIIYIMFMIIIFPTIYDLKLKEEMIKIEECNPNIFVNYNNSIALYKDCKYITTEKPLFDSNIVKGFVILSGLVIGILIIGSDIKGND